MSVENRKKVLEKKSQYVRTLFPDTFYFKDFLFQGLFISRTFISRTFYFKDFLFQGLFFQGFFSFKDFLFQGLYFQTLFISRTFLFPDTFYCKAFLFQGLFFHRTFLFQNLGLYFRKLFFFFQRTYLAVTALGLLMDNQDRVPIDPD